MMYIGIKRIMKRPDMNTQPNQVASATSYQMVQYIDQEDGVEQKRHNHLAEATKICFKYNQSVIGLGNVKHVG